MGSGRKSGPETAMKTQIAIHIAPITDSFDARNFCLKEDVGFTILSSGFITLVGYARDYHFRD